MKKTIIISSTLLMVALVAGSVFAWGPGYGRGMDSGSGQFCQGFRGQTTWNDLSQNQREELTALRQKFIDETYAARSAKFVKHQEMRLLMETSDPDRAKLGALLQEITNFQKQVMEKQIDFQLAAKKVAPGLDMGPGGGYNRGRRSGKGGHRGWQAPENSSSDTD
ncbi:MAG: periplasmic heavy metal sensor [Proteobacteria bacterium]|nr:periplasmic heavy metal sensor [Pseudomonadota bacterium]MBU1581688.1 periplasmic heavy metal sensor [Pseudomonadota bacterium]MBU2631519.1 periplasmic heavy metal sensor [Pseudomonadota bacterium]